MVVPSNPLTIGNKGKSFQYIRGIYDGLPRLSFKLPARMFDKIKLFPSLLAFILKPHMSLRCIINPLHYLGFYLFLLAPSTVIQAQSKHVRQVSQINTGWLFIKDSDLLTGKKGFIPDWQPVALPHTWNREDVMDDNPGYYRGVGWYKKSVKAPVSLQSKQVYLFFEGANQETTVFINGRKAGTHKGGYSSFSIPVSPFLNYGHENEVLVKVDNSHNEAIAPLSADFTFYGGLYRDVYWVVTDPIHFSQKDHASKGVYLTTPRVTATNATVNIRGLVTNPVASKKKVQVVTTIYDQQQSFVAKTVLSTVLNGKTDTGFELPQMKVAHPHLWSPEHPYLYTAITQIREISSGKILDEIHIPVGFRWFHFDAKEGFFLNGKPYKLMGASRHQDYKTRGNAVPDELAVRDVQLLKEMGGNFLRVAHYPQDPSILEACDRLGLLASVEIPVVNEITESEAFYRNCESMQVEMIRQNFNHPSVILWCYMNEILLRPHYNQDKEKQKTYFRNVAALARRLDSITRKEDPYRYTMLVNHGDFKRYEIAGLLSIPMVVGWNLYSGWYGGSLQDFSSFLESTHKAIPDKPMIVAEYGADADPRISSLKPVRFDKSVEYATGFHQFYWQEINKQPFVAGGIIWNLADFNSETRTETMPHINNKGLLEWDRIPKDPYYLYQALWLTRPVLKILGTQKKRTGICDSTMAVSWQLLQVASNADSVSLTLNGKAYETRQVLNGLVQWNMPFENGLNTLIAEADVNGKTIKDTAFLEFQLQPSLFKSSNLPFRQINILLGANRFFADSAQITWQPDRPYQKGGWGSIGGTFFKMANNNLLPYGTDKNILHTVNDPIYQTQQVGIQQYRLDVPKGTYELTLHFAELLGGKVEGLAYNLSGSDRNEDVVDRVFNVLVNNKMALEKFNIRQEYGIATAISKKLIVIVEDSKGIVVDFQPVSGDPVLNALELRKI
jgi:beta-galactosidase